MGRLRELCILTPRSAHDGVRVSVMSRHTLSDGRTRDHRLDWAWDLWMPQLSPGPKLVGSWYRCEISWEDFCAAYRERLKRPEALDRIRQIVRLLEESDVSVMCIEEDASRCHRGVLLEVVQAEMEASSSPRNVTQ